MMRCDIFDMSSVRYVVMVPALLWKWNSNFAGAGKSITMQTYLSSRRKKGGKINIFPDSPQEYYLPFYNYNDGFSIKVGNELGYSKALDCFKLKCNVLENAIGWMDDGEWTLSIIFVGSSPFYFLVKAEMDPQAGSDEEKNSD